MRGARTKLLVRLGVAVGVALFVYFCLVILTPTLGKIVGYADQQPPLKVSTMSELTPSGAAEAIQRLAELQLGQAVGTRELYWPVPSAIEEKRSCWLVTFTARTPIYSFCGIKQTVPPSAPAFYMSIAKSDLSTRIGKWCQ